MGINVNIKEISTQKEMKEFIKFPDRLYSGNNYYIPAIKGPEMQTLSFDKNPAFEFCRAKYWMAFKDDIIVGRVAGIINEKYNETHNIKYARFGWLDFINDFEVLSLLLHTVENWAKNERMDYIHGPLGFSSFDASGILLNGFDELPTTFGHYNFQYYPKLIEMTGYQKEIDWVEYNVKVPRSVPERYVKGAELVRERYGLVSAKIKSKKDLLRYSDGLFRLLNTEYKEVYSFSELTIKQIEYLKRQFISILRPEFVSIIVDPKDTVVAFGITLPSLSRSQQKSKGRLFPFGFIRMWYSLRKNDTVDTLLIAVQKEYQNKGVNCLIFDDIIRVLIKEGITNIESTKELENNRQINNLWNKFEYRQHKRTRCYVKKL